MAWEIVDIPGSRSPSIPRTPAPPGSSSCANPSSANNRQQAGSDTSVRHCLDFCSGNGHTLSHEMGNLDHTYVLRRHVDENTRR